MSRAAVRAAMPFPWLIPNATVFVSSGCIMVIELVAGRLIARHLGSSIYTWTSVIGVVLAGIALGNYVGGFIADRYASRPALAILFVLSSLLSAGISFFDNTVGGLTALWTLSWSARVALHVALVFFLPAAMLGTISPVVAKMALDLGYHTGRTIGSVYAWGVVGSIVGTFVTGFWLIAWFGTKAIIWGVAGILVAMAVFYGATSWRVWGCAVIVAASAVLANGPWAWAREWGEALALQRARPDNLIYSDETQYSYVRVLYLNKERDTRAFHLDQLLHSQVDMKHPLNLFYGYERVCAAITKRLGRGKQRLDNLTIGGGGYVYPRYMNALWPGSRTDVVEIDPGVTRAAKVAFGLPENTPVRSFHEDGRVFVDRLYRRKKAGKPIEPYDFIYLDVFNDVSVPYQLTTVEFARMVSELLTEDGAFLMNAIDIFDEGLFLGSLVKTLREVFPHVYVFFEGEPLAKSRATRNTFILAGLKQSMNTRGLDEECRPDCRINLLTQRDLEDLMRKPMVRVLTDDYAPVEHLLAGVVREKGKQRAAGEWATRHFKRAKQSRDAGDDEKALQELKEALKHKPDHIKALYQLGACAYRLNRLDEAQRAFTKLVGIDPAHVDAHFMLGNVHARRRQYDKAARAYRRVLELDPNDNEARHNLEQITALKRQGREGLP